MQYLLFFFVSLGASVIGAICGIGGGIIIKPTLDFFSLGSVAAVSFLSGSTVLSMTCYSVIKNLKSQDNTIDMRTGTPLALGSALGGIAGQQLFVLAYLCFGNPNLVGAIQSAGLFLITLATLIYTLVKHRLQTLNVSGTVSCLSIGLFLGLISSFLGIGGGPINLMILGYFFSMPTKTAAQNSLYIILFSQITNLLTIFWAGHLPDFKWLALALMVAGGIGGGMLGRSFNKKMNNEMVDKLFIVLMLVIMVN